MVADLSFPSCSPSAAANVRVSSRRRQAGQGQKESCQTPRQAFALQLQGRCFLRPGCRRGRIPSAEQEWAFVAPIPDLPAAPAAQAGGAARRSPFVWQPGGDSGMGAPILDGEP